MPDVFSSSSLPLNETVLGHAPGSPERRALEEALETLTRTEHELTLTIDGQNRMGAGAAFKVVQPHDHAKVLGVSANASREDAAQAILAAGRAAPAWAALPFEERAAILLRAADRLAGPWRARLNAATMLGQSKTIQQSEIDAIAELADFWRFNVSYARQIFQLQPLSPAGQRNTMDFRPLGGFVYAISPFNFTAIAGNLPTAPALMGNTVVWKVSSAQGLAAQLTMQLLEEAGLPPGVINLLTGDGRDVSDVVLADPDLAGIHFTGSTQVFQMLWSRVGANIARYRSYPRLVGETGGKGFVVAHPSADVAALKTALVRGAFEYQGQKCSAASRAYVARSVWRHLKDELIADIEGLKIGSPRDFSNFAGAMIDQRAYARLAQVIEQVRGNPNATILAGGDCDDSIGYFVRPTLVTCTDPGDPLFSTEFFGPLLAVQIYEDDAFSEVLTHVDSASPYALTGAVFANERQAVIQVSEALRGAAGNFYVNDRPTGAVVGQQPFGGSRASGTNDKAGSAMNLLRWTSPRAIKETYLAPVSHAYPHMY